MSYYDNCWHYRGRSWPTLHEALLVAWPARRCGHG